MIFYKTGVGLVGGAFDDEGEQAEAGIAIAKAGAGLEVGGIVAA